MTDNTQAEALAALIERFRGLHIDHEPDGWPAVRTREITALLDRIAELEAQLAAIGAGGVTGPLIGQPQAMPDLSALTERGAKAWAGVDAQALRAGGADMSKEREAFIRWHMDYLLTDEMLAAHVWDSQHRIAAAWQARASLSANAGEPVAIRPDIQAVLAMLDVPVIARLSSHEGKLLKPGQEPPAFESAVPLVREWDHRRACETIIAALSGRMTKENK